jgi:hypothetical protein
MRIVPLPTRRSLGSALAWLGFAFASIAQADLACPRLSASPMLCCILSLIALRLWLLHRVWPVHSIVVVLILGIFLLFFILLLFFCFLSQ